MELLGAQLTDLAIGRIKSMINTYVDKQFKYQKTDVKAKLKQLGDSLMKIQVLVAAAQNTGIEDKSLLEWLSKLRDAIYDAEYVMDVFEYRRVEKEIESWSSPDKAMVVNRARGCGFKKVLRISKLPSSSCFKFRSRATTFVKRLIFADEELNDLLNVVKIFDGLVAEIHQFTDLSQLHEKTKSVDNQQAGGSSNQGQHTQETTSVPSETVLFGRNKADEELRKLLLQSSDNSETTFSVLSVVGVGGVGKSALAQSAFNHKDVKDHFKVRAWVSVSTNFNIKNLMIRIVEAAGIERPPDFYNLIGLESIIDVLRKGLQSKRFLVVLDDVWEDMHGKWEVIAKAFNSGEQGSRILVTSRSSKVAEDMGVEEKMQIKLNPLKSEDFWALFQKYAFRDKNPESYPKHKIVAAQIANQLGGLPLAAKIVGATLGNKFDVNHWQGILTSKKWKKDGNQITWALKLSYDHLPMHLKKCFMYCSLFPKDYRYDERDLIDIWIALDCIESTDVTDKRIVDIQREYVDELVSRCFLEKVKYDNRYIIHDLLHDLAEVAAGNQVYRIEDDESLSKPVPPNVRHLYIKTNSDVEMNTALQKFAPKQLRSLVYYSAGEGESELQMSKETVENLKGLRFLCFRSDSDTEFKISECLGDLIHLRCIHFGLQSVVLPESFSKLYQLHLLHWNDGSTRVKLLSYIDKLINLRHIDNTGDADNGMLTSYLGRLKNLEVIPNGEYKIDGEEGKDIGQLAELNKIGGSLKLHVCTKLSQEEIRKANLNRKKYITEFSIIDEGGGIDNEGIEYFRPHENLEKLEISSCRDIRDINKTPTWFRMLSNLTSLELKNLPNIQGIPASYIGRLLFLRHFKLCKLTSVMQIDVVDNDDEFHGQSVLFPSLVYFEMDDMENLKGWSIPLLNNCNKTYFPKLCTVVITKCPKLLKIGESPNSIPFPFRWLNCSVELWCSLQPLDFLDEISIYGDNEGTMRLLVDMWPFLAKYLHPHPTIPQTLFSSIVLLKIHEFPQECLPTTLEALSSLKTVDISRCDNLKSLPASLHALSSLESLLISYCDQLEIVEPNENVHLLPSSIKHLSIYGYKGEMKRLVESLQTLSLETLAIENCVWQESSPGSNIDLHPYFPTSLKHLSIVECSNLKFLNVTNLKYLKVLRISQCNELEALANKEGDNALFPPSIKLLHLTFCPKLKIPVASLQMLSSQPMINVDFSTKDLNTMLLTGQQYL